MRPDDPKSSPKKYRFLDFELDPAERSLTRNSQAIDLQAQVFDLILYLVEHPGETVSKDELLARVWRNHYLGDAAIAQAVRKARRALGDDGRKQAVIHTVHGRGIRFLPEVAEHRDRTSTELQPSQRFRRLRLAALATTGMAALVLGLVSFFAQPVQTFATERLVIFPFENASGQADLDWLQVGLAQTTALLLDEAGGLQSLTPRDLAEIPTGARAQQMGLLGASRGLEARIEQENGQFTLKWKLISGSSAQVLFGGEIVSGDSSQLARRLADAVLNVLAGQPDAPLPSQPLLQDPLAAELYARSIQAIYSNKNSEARALLQAALTREPASVPLRVAYAQASFDDSDVNQSISTARAVLDDLLLEDPVAAAGLVKTIGIELWNIGEVDASAEMLRRGLELLKGADANGLRASILNALALSLNSQLDHEAAWDSAARAELIFRQLNDPYHLSLVLTNMAYFAEDQGRIFQAGKLHEESLQIRQRYRFPELIAASQYGLARIERRSGNFDRAESLLNRSLATVTELGLAHDTFDNLEELAEINMRQNRWLDAQTRIEQAASIARQNRDSLGMAWANQVLGRLALQRNLVTTETLERIESARTALEGMGQTEDFFRASLELVQALLISRDDNQPLARRAREILLQLAASDGMSHRVLRLQYDATRAEALARDGQRNRAMDAYQELVLRARTIGVIDLEAEYAIRLGRLALSENQNELARSMLAIASRWSADYHRTVELAVALTNAEANPG